MKSSTQSMLSVKSNLNKLIFLVFISFLLFSCHKDKVNPEIEGVTGFKWQVYSVQAVNDYYINPIPTDWQFNLNNDQSFSFKLGSSVCSGTYSWTAIDTVSANVIFTIKEWNNPLQSAGTASKLKNVVQAVNKCYIYKYPFLGQYPGPPFSATMILQFKGSAGFFYVYR